MDLCFYLECSGWTVAPASDHEKREPCDLRSGISSGGILLLRRLKGYNSELFYFGSKQHSLKGAGRQ